MQILCLNGHVAEYIITVMRQTKPSDDNSIKKHQLNCVCRINFRQIAEKKINI